MGPCTILKHSQKYAITGYFNWYVLKLIRMIGLCRAAGLCRFVINFFVFSLWTLLELVFFCYKLLQGVFYYLTCLFHCQCRILFCMRITISHSHGFLYECKECKTFWILRGYFYKFRYGNILCWERKKSMCRSFWFPEGGAMWRFLRVQDPIWR